MIIATARIAPCSQTNGRAAVRNARPILDIGDEWLETIAAGGFLPIVAERPPTVLDRHHGTQLGHVSVLAAGRAWWEAELVLDDAARELARVGAAVSIDAHSLARNDNHSSGVRRHTIVRLEHVCFVADHERPGYGTGARITAVREVKPADPAARVADGITRVVDGIPLRAGDQLLGPGDRVIATG